MKYTLLSLITLLSCFSAQRLHSQEDSTQSSTFTLAQAQEYALANHYKVVNADLDLEISKSKIWETTAIGLPQIDGSLGYRKAIDLEFDFPEEALNQPGNEFLSVFAADNVSQAKLNVTQLVFDGSYIVGLQAAKTYHRLSEQQKDKTDNEIKADVSASYYLVLVANENLNLLNENLDNLSASIKESEALLQQGFIESTDLEQLQLMQQRLTSAKRSAERSAALAADMLKLNMGYGVENSIELNETLDGVIEQLSLEALVGENFSAENNIDLQLMTTQAKLLKLDLRRYKMQRLPSLGAYYQYQNTAYQLDFNFWQDADWFDAQNLGLSLNIPIWSSGAQGSRIKQARLEYEKMNNTLAHMEAAMATQYKNAQSNLKSKIANKADADKGLSIANKIHSSTEKKHKQGLSSSFELSQMKNQQLEAQGAYINALMELLNAKVDLDRLQNKK